MSKGSQATVRREKSTSTDELRIVLIGGRRCGKSSVGNIILGRDDFHTNKRTTVNVVGENVVSGRQVTVVNTPGWKSACPLDLTPTRTRSEVQLSVCQCRPGPHAFVLVMPLDSTHVGTELSVKEHMGLLCDRVWDYTILVFTIVGEYEMKSVEEIIRFDDDLRALIQKCENRFHVVNIGDRANRRQVTELLEKIDQMVTTNGGHYKAEEQISGGLASKRIAKRRSAFGRRTISKHDDGTTDIRILMMGRQGSGKSSAGNTLLKANVFKTCQKTALCEVNFGEVSGKHLTVVDVPGWLYNNPLKDTSEMDKLEIQSSPLLCPPGPHAVLILVPVDEAFTKEQRAAVEEHMALLTPGVWSYAIVLFTCGDWLEDTTIEQHIETEGEDLHWLLETCGNRYHVFNNQKTDEVTQVTELLEKIREMVAENHGGHYEVDGDAREKISERKRLEEDALTLMARTHKQRSALKALFEGDHQSLQDVRMMLVAGEHCGRSKAVNHILQEHVLKEITSKEFKTQTKLTECVREQRCVAERNVTVVNCPDWPTAPPSKEIKDVLQRGLSLCSPGPHAFLVTVDVRSSFSEADMRSVEEHMELLGDRVWRNTLVLFTWGYWLGGRCVEEYIVSEGQHLKWLIEKCGYRYHVLQFSKCDNSPEVTELMEKIEEMVTRNRAHFDPLESKEGSLSGTETGYFTERIRQDEAWKKREEVMVERMLKVLMMEPEELTPPALRRRISKDWTMSMSGATRSSSLSSSAKVHDWLKRYPGPIVSSSGYDTMSENSSRLSRGFSLSSHHSFSMSDTSPSLPLCAMSFGNTSL